MTLRLLKMVSGCEYILSWVNTFDKFVTWSPCALHFTCYLDLFALWTPLHLLSRLVRLVPLHFTCYLDLFALCPPLHLLSRLVRLVPLHFICYLDLVSFCPSTSLVISTWSPSAPPLHLLSRLGLLLPLHFTCYLDLIALCPSTALVISTCSPCRPCAPKFNSMRPNGWAYRRPGVATPGSSGWISSPT